MISFTGHGGRANSAAMPSLVELIRLDDWAEVFNHLDGAVTVAELPTPLANHSDTPI